jgi:hypothetical protein
MSSVFPVVKIGDPVKGFSGNKFVLSQNRSLVV